MLPFSKWFSEIIRLRVKSITDALFKYSVIALLLAFIQSLFPHVPSWALIVSYAFAGTLLMTGIWGFIYFAIRAPNFLRSEEYQLKKETQLLLGDKQNPSLEGKVDTPPTTNTLIEKNGVEQTF